MMTQVANICSLFHRHMTKKIGSQMQYFTRIKIVPLEFCEMSLWVRCEWNSAVDRDADNMLLLTIQDTIVHELVIHTFHLPGKYFINISSGKDTK